MCVWVPAKNFSAFSMFWVEIFCKIGLFGKQWEIFLVDVWCRYLSHCFRKDYLFVGRYFSVNIKYIFPCHFFYDSYIPIFFFFLQVGRYIVCGPIQPWFPRLVGGITRKMRDVLMTEVLQSAQPIHNQRPPASPETINAHCFVCLELRYFPGLFQLEHLRLTPHEGSFHWVATSVV